MKSNGRAQLQGAALAVTESLVRRRVGTPPLAKRLLTAEEAGQYLGFKSAWPVRELKWKGELPYVPIGKRRIMFDVLDLDGYIESQKTRERKW